MSNVKKNDRNESKLFMLVLSEALYRETYDLIYKGSHVPKKYRWYYANTILKDIYRIHSLLVEANAVWINTEDDFKERRSRLKKAYNKCFALGNTFILEFNKSCDIDISKKRYEEYLTNLFKLTKCICNIIIYDEHRYPQFADCFKPITKKVFKFDPKFVSYKQPDEHTENKQNDNQSYNMCLALGILVFRVVCQQLVACFA